MANQKDELHPLFGLGIIGGIAYGGYKLLNKIEPRMNPRDYIDDLNFADVGFVEGHDFVATLRNLPDDTLKRVSDALEAAGFDVEHEQVGYFESETIKAKRENNIEMPVFSPVDKKVEEWEAYENAKQELKKEVNNIIDSALTEDEKNML